MPPDESQPSPAATAALMGAVGDVGRVVAVISNDIGYLKDQSKANAANIARALDAISTQSADLNATPAGREVLRRLRDVELDRAAVAPRVEALEDFRTEMRGAVRTLRALAGFSAFVGALVSIIWTGHALGWW